MLCLQTPSFSEFGTCLGKHRAVHNPEPCETEMIHCATKIMHSHPRVECVRVRVRVRVIIKMGPHLFVLHQRSLDSISCARFAVRCHSPVSFEDRALCSRNELEVYTHRTRRTMKNVFPPSMRLDSPGSSTVNKSPLFGWVSRVFFKVETAPSSEFISRRRPRDWVVVFGGIMWMILWVIILWGYFFLHRGFFLAHRRWEYNLFCVILAPFVTLRRWQGDVQTAAVLNKKIWTAACRTGVVLLCITLAFKEVIVDGCNSRLVHPKTLAWRFSNLAEPTKKSIIGCSFVRQQLIWHRKTAKTRQYDEMGIWSFLLGGEGEYFKQILDWDTFFFAFPLFFFFFQIQFFFSQKPSFGPDGSGRGYQLNVGCWSNSYTSELFLSDYFRLLHYQPQFHHPSIWQGGKGNSNSPNHRPSVFLVEAILPSPSTFLFFRSLLRRSRSIFCISDVWWLKCIF